MPSRADELIATLGLQPHPEGGHFREIYRASAGVMPDDGRERRSALTTIDFLLRRGERSCFHRVASDEVWHFHEGDPLELLWMASVDWQLHRRRLGPVAEESSPVAVVPADCWQAAHCLGDYTLVGCDVAPGFEFTDFAMLKDDPPTARAVCERHPELRGLL